MATKQNLRDSLIDFARQHPHIESLRETPPNTKGHVTYYYIVPRTFFASRELNDELLLFSKPFDCSYHLLLWPDDSLNHRFLGDIIWYRAPT